MERMTTYKEALKISMERYKELEEENKNLEDRIKELIGKIDQLEEENENLRKDLFHLTNDGKAK